MFCTRCGTHLPDDAAFCSSCGVPVTRAPGGVGPAAPGAMSGAGGTAAVDAPAAEAPGSAPELPAALAPAPAPATPRYAGFWRRFWGMTLDRFILGIALMPLGFLVIAPMLAYDPEIWAESEPSVEMLAPMMGGLLTVALIGMVVNWLYAALMQCSSRQATLGQMALGLRVTDDQGRRISFGRATGRFFATILTGFTFGIGYLAMLFTSRRQTLHDVIAGTLVVR